METDVEMTETQYSKKGEAKKEVPELDEKTITSAMRARVGHFKEQADSLTLEGVRRVLEKDLGLDEFALDAHKRFIKQSLQECFEADSNENLSKSSGETVEEVVNSTKEETLDLFEKLQAHQEPKELKGKEEMPGSPVKELKGKEEMPGSPVMGLLAEVDTAPNDTEKSESLLSAKSFNEDKIKKTIRKRAAYFRTNSETISLAGARRLLEGDLKLEKHALDPYRDFIKEQLDKVLQSSVAEPANEVKNNKRKKVSFGEISDFLDSVDEVEEEEVKPKKKIASKQKTQNSEGFKSKKRHAKETTKSSKKRKEPVVSMSGDSDDAKDGGDLSEDGSSRSSVEEPVKKKIEASTQAYGKRVEHLRSVIRSCGMSIPPSVYKRAKQAPESKREAGLIKELEEMLRKEGLSTNPSEKEIKEVKKQKERTKELEGIDLSNIVSSSRRRSTPSFVAPPQPKISVGSDDDGSEDDEDNNDDDDDDNEDNEDEGADDSNSDDLNEDVEDESD